jgi:hypothetical protein
VEPDTTEMILLHVPTAECTRATRPERTKTPHKGPSQGQVPSTRPELATAAAPLGVRP